MSGNNSISIESLDDYMKGYRNQIKAKYQDLKMQKDQELLNVLDINESDRIEADFKKKMKAYVKELKTSSEHIEKYEAYRKEMAKVRDLFKLIFDAKTPQDNQKIKEMFLSTKQYFKDIELQEFEKNYEKLQKILINITPEQKMKIMKKFIDLSQNPQKLGNEIQKLIDGKVKFTLSSLKEWLKTESTSRIAGIIAIYCFGNEQYLGMIMYPLIRFVLVDYYKKFNAKKSENINQDKNNMENK